MIGTYSVEYKYNLTINVKSKYDLCNVQVESMLNRNNINIKNTIIVEYKNNQL